MMIRKVLFGDAEDLLSWRNSMGARRMSRDTSKISLEDHLRWLEKRLADDGTFMFVGEQEGVGKVGVCRIQVSEESGDYEISLSISDDLRGRGSGPRLARRAIEAFWLEMELPIVAWVKESNIRSTTLFLKLGFLSTELRDGEFAQFRLAFGGLV